MIDIKRKFYKNKLIDVLKQIDNLRCNYPYNVDEKRGLYKQKELLEQIITDLDELKPNIEYMQEQLRSYYDEKMDKENWA